MGNVKGCAKCDECTHFRTFVVTAVLEMKTGRSYFRDIMTI